MAEDSDAVVNMDSALETSAMQKCTMTQFVETNRIWEKEGGHLLIDMSLVPPYMKSKYITEQSNVAVIFT
jgi:hypothetical protein